MKHFLYIFCISSCIILISCKKNTIDPAPPTSINSQNVFTNDATTANAVTAYYIDMTYPNNLPTCPLLNIGFYTGMSGDELTLWDQAGSQTYTDFYTNQLTNTTIEGLFWESIYPIIYMTNAAIEGITASNSLSPAVSKQALGESYFMRAFCYFYLVNLYGDVPLVLTTNYQTNENITRTSSAVVWQQIVSDLKLASSLLSTEYLDGTLEKTTNLRLRPTKWAACALLAKAYLYNQQWSKSIAEADTVIANSSTFQLDSLDSVFLVSSTEAIWAIQSTTQGWNTPDAQTYIIPSSGFASNYPVYISASLLNSFEQGDNRRTTWIDSVSLDSTYYYPYKYQNNSYGSGLTEYDMVQRLGDLYLIRAEAEANNGDIPDANNDLNKIRIRAGLSPVTISNQSTIISKIIHERQVELFTEWGNRWFDLKRTNTINSVMGSPTNEYQIKVPGSLWNTEWQLFPISETEIQDNPSLVQNPGY
jgi:hypothetical protein